MHIALAVGSAIILGVNAGTCCKSDDQCKKYYGKQFYCDFGDPGSCASGQGNCAKKSIVTEVHPDRAAQIKEIENTPGVHWKPVAHPRFASQAPGASSDMNGVKGDQAKNIKDLILKGEIHRIEADANLAIPESFDSAEHWPQCAKIINDIRDQSNCGCCWAFAGAEAASDRMCIATNGSKLVPLSAEDVCFNAAFLMGGCNGGQISSPWSYIKAGGLFHKGGAVSGGQYNGTGVFGKGLCSNFALPHCHHHGPQGKDPYPAEGAPGCPHESSPKGPTSCDSDAKAPHNDYAKDKYFFTGKTVTASGETEIQQAVMAGGPMEVAFIVYSDFENYASGIYHHVTGSMAGGHAVKLVGWGVEGGVKYWKIANSWNPYWGEDGYFRIRRGTNEGGIEDQAIASAPDATWTWAGDSIDIVV
jgi:cathepsin B